MEPAFDALPGVVHVRAGWAGGGELRREAVEVVFDPQRTSYEALLAVFWRNVDPFDGRGQFCDIGHEYTSAIYPHGSVQRALAEASRRKVAKAYDRPVATEIVDSEDFSVAGDFDQNYYRQHPVRYRLFRLACGRDARLAAVERAR
jgi:peptide-methionine (S)-S-oxide reductase